MRDLITARVVSNNDPELPLRPVVTPAIGIAGVILMLSGAVYTFIGIRSNQYDFNETPDEGHHLTCCNRLQIFFSSAYLVALAIVVSQTRSPHVTQNLMLTPFAGARRLSGTSPSHMGDSGCLPGRCCRPCTRYWWDIPGL